MQLHAMRIRASRGMTVKKKLCFTGKPPSWKYPNGLTMKENMREATAPHLWMDKIGEISQW